MRLRGLWAWGCAAALALGCAAREPLPTVRVAQSAEAQVAFAELQRQWNSKERLSLADLEQSFRRFLIVHADDALAPVARAQLGILLIELSRSAEAEQVVRRDAAEPRGVTRDLLDVVRAHGLRVRGDADSALVLLRPLAGKMIDATAAALVFEELTAASLAAHAEFEAVGYFDAWLLGSTGTEHERAREQIAERLGQLPPLVLSRAYATMRAERSGYSAELRGLLAERLAAQALAAGDAAAARWLLDPSAGAIPAVLSTNPELGELAASSRGVRAVDGRKVGLLLPQAADGRQSEAADVLRGVSFALGLPAETAATQLLVRESSLQVARIHEALDELAGEGVGVIVAGFDPETAERALSWSDLTSVPVLALAVPELARVPVHGFVLGAELPPQLARLAEAWQALQPAAAPPGLLSGTRQIDRELSAIEQPPVQWATPCDDPLDEPLRSEPLGSYWVSGARACGEGLLRELLRIQKERGRRTSLTLGLVLEARGAEVPSGLSLRRVQLTAGVLHELSAANRDEVTRYRERYGLSPSYWAALGYDAGVLSSRALAPLPEGRAVGSAEVAARRALVAAGLLSARGALWSTEVDGFDDNRRLPRQLRVKLDELRAR